MIKKQCKIAIIYMMMIVCIRLSHSVSLYECMNNSMNGKCKSLLYNCLNIPDCSYQLHENTLHIQLTDKSTYMPKLYFSNSNAIELYNCLKQECNLDEIDSDYLSKLPWQYCLMEVYDICKGDLQQVYENKGDSKILTCYQQYCNQRQLHKGK